MADSSVVVVGNLTADPEIRYIGSGAAVATLRLAVTARTKVGDTWQDGETSFFSVSAWRDLGENAAESLHKGQRIMVSGRLRSRSWEAGDGTKRTAVEIEADDLGPSLKWSTATVQRAGRDGGKRATAGAGARSGGSSGGDSGDGWASDKAPF